MARCCVHADDRKLRKEWTFRDNKGKEEESGVTREKCKCYVKGCQLRVSERRITSTSKDFQVKVQPFPFSPKLEFYLPQYPRFLTGTVQPSRWHENSKYNRRFPSLRVIPLGDTSTPLVTKQVQLQGNVVANKLAKKATTPEQTKIVSDDDQRD